MANTLDLVILNVDGTKSTDAKDIIFQRPHADVIRAATMSPSIKLLTQRLEGGFRGTVRLEIPDYHGVILGLDKELDGLKRAGWTEMPWVNPFEGVTAYSFLEHIYYGLKRAYEQKRPVQLGSFP